MAMQAADLRLGEIMCQALKLRELLGSAHRYWNDGSRADPLAQSFPAAAGTCWPKSHAAQEGSRNRHECGQWLTLEDVSNRRWACSGHSPELSGWTDLSPE